MGESKGAVKILFISVSEARFNGIVGKRVCASTDAASRPLEAAALWHGGFAVSAWEDESSEQDDVLKRPVTVARVLVLA